MKYKHLSLLFLISSFTTFADTHIHELPCDGDNLEPKEAHARNEWAYKCGLISHHQWYWNKYNRHDNIRKVPFYPSFYGLHNPKKYIEAPTSVHEDCHLEAYRNLRTVKFCRLISEEAPKVERRAHIPSLKPTCEETRLSALDQNMIDRATYKKLVKKNKGIVFDEQGDLNGYARCNKLKLFSQDES